MLFEVLTANIGSVCVGRLLPAEQNTVAVTKETDEKLLYIHMPIYITQTPLLSPSHTHTHTAYTQSIPTQSSHTLWLWQQRPSPSYTLNQSLFLTPSLSPKSQLPCFSTSFHLSLCVRVTACVCARAGETAGVDPSNGHMPSTPINNHSQTGFMEARRRKS